MADSEKLREYKKNMRAALSGGNPQRACELASDKPSDA